VFELGLPAILATVAVAVTFCSLLWPLKKAVPCKVPVGKAVVPNRRPRR